MTTTEAAPPAPRSSAHSSVRWTGLAGVVLAAVVAVRLLVLAPYQVDGDSMAPTVHGGQWVVVDKAAWQVVGVPRGALVTFTAPGGDDHLLKRVVGVAGDTVAIEDALLVVNGRVVEEPFVDHSRIDATYFGPFTVPDGTVFVLGDNRFGSIDSRVFGPVPLSLVDGRVVLTLG